MCPHAGSSARWAGPCGWPRRRTPCSVTLWRRPWALGQVESIQMACAQIGYVGYVSSLHRLTKCFCVCIRSRGPNSHPRNCNLPCGQRGKLYWAPRETRLKSDVATNSIRMSSNQAISAISSPCAGWRKWWVTPWPHGAPRCPMVPMVPHGLPPPVASAGSETPKAGLRQRDRCLPGSHGRSWAC